MHEFKTYHPLVNFIYFVFIIGFSCFFLHPICLGFSLACGFSYSVMLKGKKQIKKSLVCLLPMLIATALLNPAFNHEGVTILTYLPSGNPLTLESLLYGLCAGVMLVSVICHFTCYNEIMTSDKLIYLFGNLIPALSLILSMTLRFVPRFAAQLKVVANAQRCLGRDIRHGTLLQRAKHGLTILSVVTTWSLENAIDTADSMKARGYGLPGRTAFSVFQFDKRDLTALLCILFFGIYTLIGALTGAMQFRFFPSAKATELSLFDISVFAAYLLLCLCPIIIEILEVRKWNVSRSKI